MRVQKSDRVSEKTCVLCDIKSRRQSEHQDRVTLRSLIETLQRLQRVSASSSSQAKSSDSPETIGRRESHSSLSHADRLKNGAQLVGGRRK